MKPSYWSTSQSLVSQQPVRSNSTGVCSTVLKKKRFPQNHMKDFGRAPAEHSHRSFSVTNQRTRFAFLPPGLHSGSFLWPSLALGWNSVLRRHTQQLSAPAQPSPANQGFRSAQLLGEPRSPGGTAAGA